MIEDLAGHAWTLWPTLRQRVRPLRPPPSVPWSTRIQTMRGPIELHGRWREQPCTVAVIVVHGLGGNVDRPYCIRAARAVEAHGWSCLRLALRGADGSGQDFYHAGLVEDVDAAVRSATLRGYERIVVLGYSLGGHVALRYACERPDPRVRSVAAICSPLDLARGADHLDRVAPSIYRRHVLDSLRRLYAEVAARGDVPTDPRRLLAITTIREWDSLTVCPRFGFPDADTYYSTQSVASRLRHLHVPALLIAARNDPMLALEDVELSLGDANALLDVRRVGGGHVAFGPRLDLGEDAPRGLERQVLRWTERKLR